MTVDSRLRQNGGQQIWTIGTKTRTGGRCAWEPRSRECLEVKKMFVDGDDVCLLYDMVTTTPAGTAFIAEWHHVTGDRITAIRVVFDARPFAAMFAR